MKKHLSGIQVLTGFMMLMILLGCGTSAFAKDAYIIPLKEMKEATNKNSMVRVAKIIMGKGPKEAKANMSRSDNFGRFAFLVGMSPKHYLNPALWIPKNWKDLGNDVEKEEVLVTYTDKKGKKVTRSMVTDDEGHVWIDPKRVGKGEITVSFPKYSKYKATPKKTSVFSLEENAGDTLFFTDHDDTQKFTGVMKVRSDKLDTDGDRERTKGKTNLLRVAITNPYDWNAFPGAAELAGGITEGNGKKVPMVVITGSPAFMAEDIDTFYKIKGFPTPDAVHLRNLKDGSDSNPDPGDALEYKNAVFAKALDGAVKSGKLKTVIFDGDRGEKDPEVALAMAKRYPNIHFIVGIQNITSDDKNSKRFDEIKKLKNVDFICYDNKYEFAETLYKNGKLSKDNLEKVKKGVEDSNKKIAEDLKNGKIRKTPKFSLFPSKALSLKELKAGHLYFPGFRAHGGSTQGATSTLKRLGQ